MMLEHTGQPAFSATQVDRVVTFAAHDGYVLTGTIHEPREVRAAVLLSSGTGIPRRFYARFARHLASKGIAVLTYDYRGIGDSRPRSLRGFEASMSTWAEGDMSAAFAELRARWPKVPAFVVGHSIGGQLVGLIHHIDEAAGVISVAASTGSWQKMDGSYRWFVAAMMYGFVPLSNAALGYSPTSKVRMGEDLPAGVASEWATWCKDSDYFLPHITGGQLARIASFRKPWLALSFTDDSIANERTVSSLFSMYASIEPEQRVLTPAEAGTQEVGHIGFFTRNNTALWHHVTDWIDAKL